MTSSRRSRLQRSQAPGSASAAVVLALTMALTGCSGNSSDSKSSGGASGGSDVDNAKLVANNPQDRNTLEQGGTVTIPVGDWTTNFNQFHVDGNGAEYWQVVNATDPFLYNWAPDGTISPRTDFLQSMPKVETKNGKEVVTYELNPKAKWNDGTAIDYTAFLATWKAQRAPVDKGGYNNVATAGYEDVESVAKGATANEVVVTFKKAFYPPTEVFQSLLHPKLGASANAFNTLEKTNFHPELRSGPFTVQSINQTTKTIVLKPNPNWWGAKPLLKNVIFRQMENSALIPAFKNSEVDVLDAPVNQLNSKAQYAQIQGAPNVDIRRSTDLGTRVLIFNGKAASLKDVNVRKAIWQGIDREQWKKVRFGGLDYTEKPTNSNLYFSFQPEMQDNMPVTFSVAEAKKTLEADGYTMGTDGYYAKNGQTLTVKNTYFSDDPTLTAVAQLLQNQLKAIGIKLVLDNRPSSAFGSTMEKRSYDLISMGWSVNTASPITGVCQFYCSDNNANYSYLGTRAIDAKIKALGSIQDPAEQAKAINAVEKEWMSSVYGMMPLANGPVIAAYRKGLANLGPALFASMHPQWENVGWQKGSTHK